MANLFTREAIYAALFTLVSSDLSWKTKSRLWRGWDEVPFEEQPAIFMTQISETSFTERTGIPNIWHFRTKLFLYASVGQQSDKGDAPSTILNPLVDKICNLLQPSVGVIGDEQTLGGLVTRCRIEGETITDEGLLGPQGVVILPILLVVPGFA